ncbi:glycosyltransferase 87 family protein [Streptomyces sp. NRRL F-4489]|uniref:glycosyltransferase 87 family protein n=1 Tax=Streptomyces sp. NRRL F-4489 TaxID=1609095 RepID=UPI00099F2A92|nr:glycosyltransferase 87 family protein [Streptomyces sp. NRRL F-4489]
MNLQLLCKRTEFACVGRLPQSSRTLGRSAGGERGRDRREVWWWGACALAALGLALFTSLVPHRTWGLLAATGYGCAAVAVALRARRRRTPRAPAGTARLPAVIAVAGAVVAPLVLLILTGRGQLEVAVVERAGELLLNSGSPYLSAPATVADYNPYLPGMAAFGLPRAMFGDGPLTDARWWMAATFLLSIGGAVTVLCRGRGRADEPDGRSRRAPACGRDGVPVLLWLAACPLVALPLAVGGIDLPVIGLMCWALAMAGRGKAVGAGLLLGAAAALKWTAWPAVPVVVALMAARYGRRKALSCGAATVVTVTAAVVPFLLTAPGAFAENVLAFPLGLATTASPAESPLPGRLLAAYVPGGALVAMVLLSIAALGVAASLLIRPPRTVHAAADRLALGLALAMALMPATRFGYLVYPLVLWAWPRLTAQATAGSPTVAPGRVPQLPCGRRPLTQPSPGEPVRDADHAEAKQAAPEASPVHPDSGRVDPGRGQPSTGSGWQGTPSRKEAAP